MAENKSKIISEYHNSSLRIEIGEHNLISITANSNGREHSVYLYPNELQDALNFVKKNIK